MRTLRPAIAESAQKIHTPLPWQQKDSLVVLVFKALLSAIVVQALVLDFKIHQNRY
jgi:hypothetical protein